MPRLSSITRRPSVAQDVAPEVKLTLLRDVLGVSGNNQDAVSLLDVLIPIFVNKDPENPVT